MHSATLIYDWYLFPIPGPALITLGAKINQHWALTVPEGYLGYHGVGMRVAHVLAHVGITSASIRLATMLALTSMVLTNTYVINILIQNAF